MGFLGKLFGKKGGSTRNELSMSESDMWNVSYDGATFDNALLKKWAMESEHWWVFGVMLAQNDPLKVMELATTAFDLVEKYEGLDWIKLKSDLEKNFKELENLVNGVRGASAQAAHNFVVIFNAIDAGCKAASVEAFRPAVVRALSVTMLATLEGDKNFVRSKTLPFLKQWQADVSGAPPWILLIPKSQRI